MFRYPYRPWKVWFIAHQFALTLLRLRIKHHVLIWYFLINLNNYFRLHVCLSFRTSVRPSHFHFFRFPAVISQNVTNKSCLACVENEKYASWVIIRPQWDCCCRGEAEVRIIDFKTTWSKFQKANQTATKQGNAKRISNQNMSLFTSPESVPSSCVHKHT